MNFIGKKGSMKEIGVFGVYKKVVNFFVKIMNWDWIIDLKGL